MRALSASSASLRCRSSSSRFFFAAFFLRSASALSAFFSSIDILIVPFDDTLICSLFFDALEPSESWELAEISDFATETFDAARENPSAACLCNSTHPSVKHSQSSCTLSPTVLALQCISLTISPEQLLRR